MYSVLYADTGVFRASIVIAFITRTVPVILSQASKVVELYWSIENYLSKFGLASFKEKAGEHIHV